MQLTYIIKFYQYFIKKLPVAVEKTAVINLIAAATLVVPTCLFRARMGKTNIAPGKLTLTYWTRQYLPVKVPMLTYKIIQSDLGNS